MGSDHSLLGQGKNRLSFISNDNMGLICVSFALDTVMTS